jgi:hypothetical protein
MVGFRTENENCAWKIALAATTTSVPFFWNQCPELSNACACAPVNRIFESGVGLPVRPVTVNVDPGSISVFVTNEIESLLRLPATLELDKTLVLMNVAFRTIGSTVEFIASGIKVTGPDIAIDGALGIGIGKKLFRRMTLNLIRMPGGTRRVRSNDRIPSVLVQFAREFTNQFADKPLRVRNWSLVTKEFRPKMDIVVHIDVFPEIWQPGISYEDSRIKEIVFRPPKIWEFEETSLISKFGLGPCDVTLNTLSSESISDGGICGVPPIEISGFAPGLKTLPFWRQNRNWMVVSSKRIKLMLKINVPLNHNAELMTSLFAVMMRYLEGLYWGTVKGTDDARLSEFALES